MTQCPIIRFHPSTDHFQHPLMFKFPYFLLSAIQIKLSNAIVFTITPISKSTCFSRLLIGCFRMPVSQILAANKDLLADNNRNGTSGQFLRCRTLYFQNTRNRDLLHFCRLIFVAVSHPLQFFFVTQAAMRGSSFCP